VVKLQDRIEKAAREIAQNYGKALKEIEELKKRMNDLESSISGKGNAETSENMNRLSSGVDMLNELTDSLILESGRAWEEYKEIEHDCKIGGFEPTELRDLRYLCKKTEEFAADLLCYSLALFKRKEIQNSLY
jgi:uncharacterized protein YukE